MPDQPTDPPAEKPLAGEVIVDDDGGDDVAEAIDAVEATMAEAYDGPAADIEEAVVLDEREIVEEPAAAEATAATVDALPVVASETEPEPPVPPPAAYGGDNGGGVSPPAVQTEAQGDSAAWGCLRSLLLVLLGSLLGLALTLTVLLALNGNLSWSTPGEVALVSNQVRQLSADVSALRDSATALEQAHSDTNAALELTQADVTAVQGEVDALQEQVVALASLADDLAATQDQVSGLQDTTTAMGETMTAMSDTVEVISGDVLILQDRVGQALASTRRSDAFLDGLRRVMAELQEEDSGAAVGPAQSVTPTVQATVTATSATTSTFTLTPTPEANATVTATPEATPTISATLPTPSEAGPDASATVAPSPAETATPAPEVPSTPAAAATPGASQGIIRGFAYEDTDGNGRRDPGEPGIAGVKITLRAITQPQISEATTDDDGAYRFEDLPAGRYVLTETDPPNHASTTLNAVSVIVRGPDEVTVDFGDYRLGQ